MTNQGWTALSISRLMTTFAGGSIRYVAAQLKLTAGNSAGVRIVEWLNMWVLQLIL
jgi:Ni,Fe-hydrogenase I cytochrome b subunit